MEKGNKFFYCKDKIIFSFIILFFVFLHSLYISKVVANEQHYLLQIDTNLENAEFDHNGIHIEGWKLATVADTKLEVYLDNKKIDENYIKYSYKYALTSIVKGYGNAVDNPKPNFDIDIPTTDINQGNHTLKIDFITTDNQVLQEVEKNIYIDKGIKYLLNLDTELNNMTFDKYGIHIEGWKLATIPNTKLEVYIDNKNIDENYIKYSYKYALTSIVKRYGNAVDNPKPNFDIDIPTTDINDGAHILKIDLVSENSSILQTVKYNIKIDKSVKSKLNIDTGLENAKFNKNIIHIEGWKLATVADTKLEVYLDNKKIDENYIKYSYKYALTSIVKGYGNAVDNPKPNFDIDIPTTDINQGNHTLKIDFITTDNQVLQEVEKNIYIDKGIKYLLNLDTELNNMTFDKYGIHIEGWKLATVADTKLEVYIDNKKIDENYIEYSYKYALTSIVKGYGNAIDNPMPNFDIDIPTTDISDGGYVLKIDLVSENSSILQTVKYNIKIDKSVKSKLNLDTELNNMTFDKYGIHIEGWKLATIPNTKLEVYIDNKKIDENHIKYSYKYALTSIVKGYGNATDNPKPNFDIDIPTTEINDGPYVLKIDLVSENSSILQTVKYNIKIDKSVKSKLNLDTNINNVTFGKYSIHIEGWKLATVADTKLNVYLNNNKINEECISYSCPYPLTTIVKGYGNAEDNALPVFSIDIPTNNFQNGKYDLKIELVTKEDKVLQEVQSIIYVKDQYRGIDVSEFNGVVDWRWVKRTGIEFAMIRLGYRGYRYPRLVLDNKAIENIRNAHAMGLKVGVYFVTQAVNCDEAREEALWVIKNLDLYNIKLEYPVALDVELSTANISKGDPPGRADLLDSETRTMICRAFCDVINYNGRNSMIYANTNWFTNKMDLSQLQVYDIWLANYKEPKLNGEYDMWQYTNKGEIVGISGNVDVNIGYKSY